MVDNHRSEVSIELTIHVIVRNIVGNIVRDIVVVVVWNVSVHRHASRLTIRIASSQRRLGSTKRHAHRVSAQ